MDAMKIAIIGGTGDLGSGIAYQLAKAGHSVTIGSRTAEKGAQAAAALSERLPEATVAGTDNLSAASAGELVIMTVPYGSHADTLAQVRDAVQGKIFVDTTVPLVPPKVMRVQLPEGGSLAKKTQELLGEDVRVVSAFQNVAAAHLQEDDGSHNDCDILVTGNVKDAREVVVQLAQQMGMRAWHAGPVDNSAVAEGLTSILIFLNKNYKIAGAGIRITGEPAGD